MSQREQGSKRRRAEVAPRNSKDGSAPNYRCQGEWHGDVRPRAATRKRVRELTGQSHFKAFCADCAPLIELREAITRAVRGVHQSRQRSALAALAAAATGWSVQGGHSSGH